MSQETGGPRPAERLVPLHRFTAAAVIAVLFWATVTLAGVAGSPDSTFRTTTLLGFLLLAALLVGETARSLNLPGITGYLLAGIAIGPHALALLSAADLERLDLVNRLAIGVIAVIAGGELRLSMLRERGRSISFMLGFQIMAVFTGVWLALLLARPLVPFLADVGLGAAAVLAAVFASVATINSPAVAIAVLNETRARGPVASTTLGIVVAADVVVVLFVTATLSLAQAVLSGGGFEAGSLLLLGWELVGAIVAGALLGGLLDLYLRTGGAHMVLVAIFLPLLGAQIASAIHVEFMLFMLSAGFFIENVSPVDGEPLLHALETVSVPAYALFFTLAGASIQLPQLRVMWPMALLVVAVRALALWGGCRVGARLAGAEPAVERYAWLGLFAQAGVALGLITVVARVLPGAGATMVTLFLATLAINQVAGPVLFKLGLDRAGELAPASEDAGEPAAVPG